MHLMQNKKVPNMILQTTFDMITWFYTINVKSGYVFFERNFSVRLSLKNFIPSYAFDDLLCQNWPFLPPNLLTLGITLMYQPFNLGN
jgi:hypothetical protein